MKRFRLILSGILLSCSLVWAIGPNPWKNKNIAVLGDSISDSVRVGTERCYWEYLSDSLQAHFVSYAVNGATMRELQKQAERLYEEGASKIDAILVFAGTNDFYEGTPLGCWYIESEEEIPISATRRALRKKREIQFDETTFRGRINRLMDRLKGDWPDKQIVLLTPLHRGYAVFGPENVQPDERYANRSGLFIDDYVSVIKEAGNVWAVPVIDLNALSGLYPLAERHSRFFHDGKSDRLHPNAAGHLRLAEVLYRQFLLLPCF